MITRSDASLATALVISAIVLFHQPLSFVLESVHDIEGRYRLDFLPALVVLVVTLGVQQYRKRREVVAERQVAIARLAENERLLSLGKALAPVLDAAALYATLCRFLPAFIGERQYWLLTREDGRWVSLSEGAAGNPDESDEALEERARQALRDALVTEGCAGLVVQRDVCYPLMAGTDVVGVLGIQNTPALATYDREALAAVGTLIALAIRNIKVLEILRRQGRLDELTGCVSRAAGLADLRGELKRARRTRRSLSILMIDVDCFKTVNDTRGHGAGDRVLEWLGAQLPSILRSTDVCCRYGGDEFLVILPDTASSGAQMAAEKVLHGVRHRDPGATGVDPFTLSIGVATTDAGFEMKALVSRADTALYVAKREGRDRVRVAADASDMAPTKLDVNDALDEASMETGTRSVN